MDLKLVVSLLCVVFSSWHAYRELQALVRHVHLESELILSSQAYLFDLLVDLIELLMGHE